MGNTARCARIDEERVNGTVADKGARHLGKDLLSMTDTDRAGVSLTNKRRD